MTFRCLPLFPIAFPSACPYSLAALALLATGLIGCSSDSKNSGALDQQSGSISPDGIGESFPEQRPVIIDLDRLEGDNGYSLVFESDEFGSAFDDSEESEFPLESAQRLQGIGDVNGDGISDFTFNTSARTWVVSGNGARQPVDTSVEVPAFSEISEAADTSDLSDTADTPETVDASDASDASDTSDTSTDTGTGTGFVLEEGLRLIPLGDINGDGFDDVGWLTSDEVEGTRVSGARVVFGRADDQLATALQGLPDGADGFELVNKARGNDIRSIAAAGDLNADGFDDVLVGSYAYNGEDLDAPIAWVIYGRADDFASRLDVSSLTGTKGLTFETRLSDEQRAAVRDNLGTGYNASVTGGFDFNGDGIGDIAIGANSFDWIENIGSSHTYIVYGSVARTAEVLDLPSLDGVEGVDVVGPDLFYQPSPDGLAAVGDINADGIADLAILDEAYTGGVGRVLLGGLTNAGSRLDRTALSPSASIEFRGEKSVLSNIRLTSVGDIDGDGIDDLGVYNNGSSAIVYGSAEPFPANIDLSKPAGQDITGFIGNDDAPLVALGDIDGDGVDDLGIGWSKREINAGTYPLDDINDDGVEDLGINAYEVDLQHRVRVLYGYADPGFVAAAATPPGPAPLQVVDPFFFNRFLAAVDATARSPFDYLENAQVAGIELDEVVANCTAARMKPPPSDIEAPEEEVSTEAPVVKQFDCGDEPLSFSFTWGSGKLSGEAGGQFTRAAFVDDVVQALQFASVPAPSDAPGGNPYQAHLSFDRDGLLVIGRSGYLDDESVPRCVIDVATRLTTDDASTCALLLGETRDVLMRIFGTRSDVRDLQYLR